MKRIIDWSKYPMVIDNSGYKNTHTKLPCKCQVCGEIIYKSIHSIDQTNDCYCKICGRLKAKQTNKERYGVENPFQCNKFQEKAKQTIRKKYGVEHALQYKEFQEKLKQTNKERYGVDYPMKSEKIKEKSKQTNIERYGVNSSMQYEEVNKKRKQTIMERYGVENALHSDEFKEKIKQTNIEKYGAENTFQCDEFKEKIKQTNKEKYGVEYHSQINRESYQIDITSSKENFEIYLKTFEDKPTTGELTEKLGYKNQSSISNLLNQWDLWKYIDQYRSTQEKQVDEYIQSLGFQTEHKRIGIMEIDIFTPEKNIGFEFNGIYWHSENFGGKDEFYHRNKQINALNEGITLYHIWEWEWLNNPKKVKSLIRNILGIDNDIEDEISKINESIIITNNDITINKLYEKHGFIKVKEIEPDYTYVYNNKQYPKSWKENNENYKIFKVWDCGKTEWKKINNLN